MIDVRIDASEGHFKFRVSGALRLNDKYLFVKMNENKFYCLPGGHVELGEDSEKATLREMEEELGFPVKIVKRLGEVENFYVGKDGSTWHELGYYFEVEPENFATVNLKDYDRLENDKGFIQKLHFKWLSLEEAEKEFYRPDSLLEILKAEQPVHLICDYRTEKI